MSVRCSDSSLPSLRRAEDVRFSIIMPVLNEAASINAALTPLQALRSGGHQVILVDGGSVDATPVLAASLVDQVVTAGRGRARQMNAGAAAARGDVLLFLHADTLLPDDAIAAVVSVLPKHVWGRFDVRIAGRPRMLRVVAALMNLRSRLSGIATGDQAIFVTRSAFEAIGGFPEQPLMEDIEFSRRMLRSARPACLVSRVTTSGRRWERHGIWRTILLMWRLRFDYWRGVPAARLAARYDSGA